MIQGLFETHINVGNYEVSAEFYERVLGLIPLHEDPARARLEERGVETTNFFGEKEAPLSVFSFMPAVSVYFNDPDGHSVELLDMLGGEQGG